MKRSFSLFSVLLLLLPLEPPEAQTPVQIQGLRAPAQIVREANGIPHIFAKNDHDVFFLQGWVHAQDRFFQMDVTRRLASGTLAELLGLGALRSDVELRTIGLRRAAERSLQVLSREAQAALHAYTAGVNAFLESHPLPPEYTLLELSQVTPWSPIDSLVIGKAIAFSLSFDLDIQPTLTLLQYQGVGAVAGFNGTVLYFEDLFRSEPFDHASTVPDASQPPTSSASAPPTRGTLRATAQHIRPETLDLARAYLERIREVPLLHNALRPRNRPGGSNEWAISGRHTVNGFPLLANDPHLDLPMPATFYQTHLRAPDLDVSGSSFAGIPHVILGHNRFIAWRATANFMDVTDTFQEQVVADATSPSGLSIVHQGQREHIIPLPLEFRRNILDGTFDNFETVPPGPKEIVPETFIFVPPAVLIVPRRNEGPILSLNLASGTALSVQYTGFSGTRELESFLTWNRARNIRDFVRGLQFFDFGSQNWAYADIRGNIAYFTSGELPVREDLQAGTVNGLPPFFIRNGTGGNEWVPDPDHKQRQAIPFDVLPFEEMPQIVNPPAGFFVNANNDPIGATLDNNPLNQLRPGGGILYLNPGYPSFRAGHITQMIHERLTTGSRKVSFEDMKTMQADTVMLDAQVFVPHMLQAFQNAQESATPALQDLATDSGVVEAVARLRAWDFTTPTGIPEGFDASDEEGVLSPPTGAEIRASVAATIYAVWRSRILANTIDAPLDVFGLPRPDGIAALGALRHLLDNFELNGGMGASGLNFFTVPGVEGDAATRRDILLLKSVSEALDLLAGDAFAEAFDHTTNQDDYLWGRLHRIVFRHPLGGPFNAPPAGGAFPPPLPDLIGIPTDGGFQVVDSSNHDVRAASSNAFMFDRGPVNRFVSEMGPGRVRAESSLPGGESGVLGSPFYVNLLGSWLTNDTFELRTSLPEILADGALVQNFVPAR